MTAPLPRIEPFGDRGVLVTLSESSSVVVSRRVHAVARAIEAETTSSSGWSKPIPAAASVLVPVDPREPGVAAAVELLRALVPIAAAAPTEDGPSATIEIPTRYGGDFGPDLASVAEAHGLSERTVIDLHASVDYEVLFLGFAPGFAYLGELPEAIATPRLSTPRVRVPAGSVAIAGRHTAIYPFETPGGWQLIGRTEVRLWDVDREPPALLVPGTLVRFVPLA